MKLFRFEEVGIYKNLMSVNGKSEDVIISVLNKEDWLKRNP